MANDLTPAQTPGRGKSVENVDFYGSGRRVSKSAEVFGQRLKALGKDLGTGRALELQTKQIALRLFNEIVRNTPVRTGYARANWAVDQTPNIEVIEKKPGKDVKYPAPEVKGRVGSGLIYYIKNGLPYIPFLEAGGSNQKPTGFIANAIFFVAKQIRQK
jgi:hypothetical protein